MQNARCEIGARCKAALYLFIYSLSLIAQVRGFQLVMRMHKCGRAELNTACTHTAEYIGLNGGISLFGLRLFPWVSKQLLLPCLAAHSPSPQPTSSAMCDSNACNHRPTHCVCLRRQRAALLGARGHFHSQTITHDSNKSERDNRTNPSVPASNRMALPLYS